MNNVRCVAMYTPRVPRARKMTDGEIYNVDQSRYSSLQNALRDIEKTKGAIEHVDLFCDYDGVLAPIAPRPQDARLSEETVRLLRRLSNNDSMHMHIVSGRSLADIRARIGIPCITYAGNHGLEIDGPSIKKIQQIPNRMHDTIRTLAGTLQRAMQAYPGVIVEDKMLAVAVHFRQSAHEQIPLILNDVSALVAGQNADHLLRVASGKSVVEIRPNVDWNKGKAIRFLLEGRHGADWPKRVLPVYLGDDETDEDAFRVLRNRGITVRVGHQSSAKTAARYTLQNTDEVSMFLDRLLHIFP